MLYTGVNHFNWQTNNVSDTPFLTSSSGTTLTADGSTHTKGADTAVLSALAYDVWGISIAIAAGSTDTAARRQMIDILIDPAGGTSWSVLINNLLCNSPGLGLGSNGFAFYFPLFIPAGSTVGARTQDLVGSGTCRIGLRVVGQPTRPDLVKVGHKVQTIGAVTASTSGVALTPGTSGAAGTYSASLGTLTNDAWWWQLGLGSSDATMSAQTYTFDVAHDATAKYICMQGVSYKVGVSTEVAGKDSMGEYPPIRHAPAGTDVYVRGSATSTPDTGFTAVVYAVT